MRTPILQILLKIKMETKIDLVKYKKHYKYSRFTTTSPAVFKQILNANALLKISAPNNNQLGIIIKYKIGNDILIVNYKHLCYKFVLICI